MLFFFHVFCSLHLFLCLSALFHWLLLARHSYGLFFRFTTAANMNPLLTDEEFNQRLRKARASDSTTAVDNVDTHSLPWRPTSDYAESIPHKMLWLISAYCAIGAPYTETSLHIDPWKHTMRKRDRERI